ncbi:MAG: sigma-70 family RNA polymerase sigma factor [Planctomycetota bacterium]
MSPETSQQPPDPEPDLSRARDLDEDRIREFVEELRVGSVSAHTWLFRTLWPRAFVVARLVFQRDLHRAEDIAQRVLTKMLGPRADGRLPSIFGYDPDQPFRPWFDASVVFGARDELRAMASRERREREAAERMAANQVFEEPIDSLVLQEDVDRVVALRQSALTSEQDEMIEMWLQEVPHKEIAARVGIGEGTSWSRINKIKGILRELLSE